MAGSDTTRHSITGGLLALNQHPAEYAKLRANPALLESAVPEIIRWQSPVAYMRRTPLADVEIGGKTIRKGEKIAMWYVSGNRDETRHRAGRTSSSSTARGRASTPPSASASIAALASDWPRCSCAWSGRRCCGASR